MCVLTHGVRAYVCVCRPVLHNIQTLYKLTSRVLTATAK